MTKERRQEIYYRMEFLGQKQKDIAEDLKITSQAITNDKRRHPGEWQEIQEYVENFSREFQDKTIAQNRSFINKLTNPAVRAVLLAEYPEEGLALVERLIFRIHDKALERRYGETYRSSNGEASHP